MDERQRKALPIDKALAIERSLSDILQILSLTLVEKIPLLEAPNDQHRPMPEPTDPNQLKLFDL